MVTLVWLLFFAWLPSLRLFPLPGKLAIILLVAGLLRGLLRRLFGRGRS
jgi:hypothetical protein